MTLSKKTIKKQSGGLGRHHRRRRRHRHHHRGHKSSPTIHTPRKSQYKPKEYTIDMYSFVKDKKKKITGEVHRRASSKKNKGFLGSFGRKIGTKWTPENKPCGWFKENDKDIFIGCPTHNYDQYFSKYDIVGPGRYPSTADLKFQRGDGPVLYRGDPEFTKELKDGQKKFQIQMAYGTCLKYDPNGNECVLTKTSNKGDRGSCKSDFFFRSSNYSNTPRTKTPVCKKKNTKTKILSVTVKKPKKNSNESWGFNLPI